MKRLNNFNGLMIIIASLSSGPIFRLKRTWERLTRNKLKGYEEVCILMSTDKSSKNYRNYMHTCNPPLVPHLGLYLTDLTFIEDGNPDYLPNGFVNFTKRKMVGDQLLELLQYQQKRFNLFKIDKMIDFFDTFPLLSENDQYATSLLHEPRLDPSLPK